MSFVRPLDSALVATAKAIGVLDRDGNLDTGWFHEPLARLERVLVDDGQREALLDLVQEMLPRLPDAPAPGERWHPLLATGDGWANVHLVFRTTADRVDLAVAARAQGSLDADGPLARLHAEVPILRIRGTSIDALVGTREGPLRASLRVRLGWTMPADLLTLAAIRIDVSAAPFDGASGIAVTLEAADLGDGRGARDIPLDPAALGADGFVLLATMVRQQLRERAAGLAGGAQRVAAHVGALLGFDDGIPRLPVEELGRGPAASRAWLRALLVDDDAGLPLARWLGHLAALVGGPPGAVSGIGTHEDPIVARVLAFDESASVDVRASVTQATDAGRRLELGVRTRLVPSGATPVAAVLADLVAVSFPLDGTARAVVMPHAAVLVRAPGGAGPLVDSDGARVASVQAGIEWDGRRLSPRLELVDCTLLGGEYPRIDLTQAGSVVAIAGELVRDAIMAALGESATARRLAALAGLVAPAGDPGWPHAIDLATLAADPARAIAGVHAAALRDPDHGWGFLLAEIGGLVGLDDAVTGTGTAGDPWRLVLDASAPVALELVAWNDAPLEPQSHRLRVGLRAVVASHPWRFSWSATLLAHDRAGDDGELTLFGDQHVALRLAPAPVVPDVGGVTIAADAFGVDLHWPRGGAITATASLANLAIGDALTTSTIGSLAFPAAAGDAATVLGVAEAALAPLLRRLLVRATLDWSSLAGLVVTSLLGLHRVLPGMPSDWPTFDSVEDALADPVETLRAWLSRVVTGVSADGRPFAPEAMNWLGVLLARTMRSDAQPEETRDDEAPPLPEEPPPRLVTGAGHPDDPWAIPVAPEVSTALELCAWLEPAGPPRAWLAPLALEVSRATGFGTLLDLLRQASPLDVGLRDAFTGLQRDLVVDGLNDLGRFLAMGDGMVESAAQIPEDAAWSAGTMLHEAHARLPQDPGAIAQILARVDELAPSARAVVLVGPRFTDRSAWAALLASAEAARPGSTSADAVFALRGVGPSASVGAVAVVADVYVAELRDEEETSAEAMVDQLDAIADRLDQLRPGVGLVLVGHSTAGLAVRAFAERRPARTVGIVTLGTPHVPAVPPVLVDVHRAAALRCMQRMFPAGFGDDAIARALAHLIVAADGFVEPAAGAAALPRRYPIEQFASATGIATGGVPALALGSVLPSSLLEWLRLRVADRFTQMQSAGPDPAPTHLAFGTRLRLPISTPASAEASVDARVRVNRGRIRLAPTSEVIESPRVVLALDILLARDNAWLVGGPSAFAGGGGSRSTRLRHAHFGLDWIEHEGAVSMGARLRLDDVAVGGDTIGTVTLGDASVEAAIGELTRTLGPEIAGSTTPVATLFSALSSLEIAVANARGEMGISADAFTALRFDPGGFLEPRLHAALAHGLVGFSGPEGGPWIAPFGSADVELRARPWSLRLRPRETSAPAEGPPIPAALELAPGLRLPFDVTLGLPPAGTGTPTLQADAALELGRCALRWSSSTGRLVLDAPPFVDALELIPTPPPTVLSGRVRSLIPRLLLSSAASALLRAMVAPSLTVPPLEGWLAAPGASLAGSRALGRDGRIAGDKLARLLGLVATGLGQDASDGLRLPGDVVLRVTGDDPVSVRIATVAPLGGRLSFDLGVDIDALRHARPRGTLTLTTELPGDWPSVAVSLAIDEQVSLRIVPEGIPPIQLLPSFTGLGALAGSAHALLPRALDEVVAALGPPAARSPWARLVLAFAEAVGIYDEVGGFAAHAAELTELATEGSLHRLAATAQEQWVAAAVALLGGPTSPLAGALPGQWSALGRRLQWTMTLDGSLGQGDVVLSAGWDDTAPTISIAASGLALADGAVVVDAFAGLVDARPSASARVRLPLADSLGLAIEPALEVATTNDGFAASFLPLGVGTGDALSLSLSPELHLHVGPDGVTRLVQSWVFPLAAEIGLAAARPAMTLPLWSSGPTARELLTSCGIVEPTSDGGDHLVLPLPGPDALLGRLLLELTRVAQPAIQLAPELELAMVEAAGALGVRLRGRIERDVGELVVSPLFGDGVPGEADRGVTLRLFQVGTDPAAAALAPALDVVGLGLALRRRNGTPLVGGRGFAIGEAAASGFLRIDLDGGFEVSDLGAELQLRDFGLPLGQAAQSSGNPVASSLLGSGLAGDGGDRSAPTPTVDVVVSRRNGRLSLVFGGQDGPLWVDVQRGFGPVYIERVGVRAEPTPGAAIMIDGAVKVGGLALRFDGLGVTIPLDSVVEPSAWQLGLEGLATSFTSEILTITGGLKKVAGPPIEYRGAMLVSVAERTFAAIGAYARPTDAQGSYTSLFVFASAPFVLGGPPFFFVTELAGGFGYNRRLVVPTDVDEIGSFPLLAALDDDSLVDDPMRALDAIGTAIPPRRGSLWVAAGLEFSTFAKLKTRAVVYASLDRALEIGLVGISRMTLPTEDAALVHVELALQARYSRAEGLLSVRAQLTDSSWLLSRDCELTGGFAFFLWFHESQFVLTLGGYAPGFVRPEKFPDVPRLGFDWHVDERTTVKGGCYFALTNSCLMTGGSLEASYRRGGIRAWFETEADVLISWDPFQYDVRFSIDVGASWTKRVCFIKCVTLHFSVTVGASLHLEGPPLHGEVTVSLAVASVTIAFGSPAKIIHYIEDWAEFAAKYLAGDAPAVAIRAVAGTAPPSDDTPVDPAAPWTLAAEFELATQSRMPASSYTDPVANTAIDVPSAHRVDLAPMGKTSAGPDGVRSHHRVVVLRRAGASWVPVSTSADRLKVSPEIGRVPEATWRFIPPDDLAAAANTLPALVGLGLRAVASFEHATPEVAVDRIAQTERVSHPLPFATLQPPERAALEELGVNAETVLRSIDDADPGAYARACEAILATDEVFAAARAQLGTGGLSPTGVHALHAERSSAPRIVPIAADLALRANGLARPPQVTALAAPEPIGLVDPRLHAVIRVPSLQRHGGLAMRTTVTRFGPSPVGPRGRSSSVTPPRPTADVLARLTRIDRATPTAGAEANDGGTSFTHPLVGRRVGAARRKMFDAAARELLGTGVLVPTSTLHVWELPPARARSLSIATKGAWRVVEMARSGNVLRDSEAIGDHRLALSPDAARVAVMNLGHIDGKVAAPALGAVSSRFAPVGEPIACGWETGEERPRLGERTVLGRGAVVMLPRPAVGMTHQQRRTSTMARMSEAVAGQPAVATWLPLATGVVIVLLDTADPTAAQGGDLGISIRPGRVDAPLRVETNRRIALVYGVHVDAASPRGAQVRDRLEVAVASRTGFRLAGVIGVAGRASDWAERLRRDGSTRLVPRIAVGAPTDLRIVVEQERDP